MVVQQNGRYKMKQKFIKALQNNSVAEMQLIPKSDLHNHAGRGGNIKYIEKSANVKIEPRKQPFDSMNDMQSWFENNVKCHCPGIAGWLMRIEAAFAQAKNDNITILALEFGLGDIDAYGHISDFIKAVDDLRNRFAPDTIFYPEFAVGREQNPDAVLDRMDEILSYNWFKSIDICNNEFAQPIKNFKPLYKKAKSTGLRLKAHVGEFGTADDVMEAVEELELNEVHHGIAASTSPQIMKWLAKNKIQLNVCPTSNVMLKVVESYATHPIRILYDYGISVTINTDDLLIFNQSVSEEYLNLYNAGLMNAEELDKVRENGLSNYKFYFNKRIIITIIQKI
ncbi:MAG: amidohydrolase family protein [Saccharofermentanales bacterium]